MSYYYAELDEKDICRSVSEFDAPMTEYNYIQINSLDNSLIGLWYDRYNEEFVEAPVYIAAEHSSDEIQYKDQEVWLNDVIDGKAEADHTHDEYALNNHVHSGYASSNHSHSNYASSDHTHSQYANSNHTHTQYASSSHTHNYLPLTGGTLSGNVNCGKNSINNLTSIELSPSTNSNNGGFIDFHYNGSSSDYTSRIIEGAEGKLTVEGDLNVNGVVRCNGSQVFYINDTNAVIGSANASGLVTLAAGSSATMVASGANLSVPNIIPRNNGTNFSIGTSSARFKNIYLQNNPSVSSDERLKEGVQQLPIDNLAEFIKGIKLVKYNYIGDDKERIGVIAQQLQEVNPEIAKYIVKEEDDGYLSLCVADLVFPLIAAVRDLQKRIEELEKGE